jgi:hypothetical protein
MLSLFVVLMFLVSLLSGFAQAGALPRGNAAANSLMLSPVPTSHAFITYKDDGMVGCRDATPEEAQALKLRFGQPVHEITLDQQGKDRTLEATTGGLQIILRATNQLENFPAAKAAFLNAAAHWQTIINTPITVVIDVDFGPRWFGEKYDTDVLGQTDSQDLGESSAYSDVRNQLVGIGGSAGIYSSLPFSSVPTDIGNTSYIIAPSALWRALSLLAPVADPTSEQSSIGDPPAVGFNSKFSYDFDPSDGIDANKIDFDAVATHEIGHVLGFDSNTGDKELNRTDPVAVTIWDLFRFRPGTTSDSFATAQRILSSGGSQSYFDGSRELALSTGRPDGTGGDKEQASHWKDDRFTGQYIGIMDPTLADGVRSEITDNDIAALKSFGYQVNPAGVSSDAPTITDISYGGGKKLKVIGIGFSGQIEVRINGLVVSPINLSVNGSGKKITIKAAVSEFHLQGGSNQVQVIRDGVSSNTFTLLL